MRISIIYLLIIWSLAGISQDSEAIRILEKYNRHVDPYGVVDSITHMIIKQERSIFAVNGEFLNTVSENFYSVYGDNYYVYENETKKHYSGHGRSNMPHASARDEFLIKFNLNMVMVNHALLDFQVGVKYDSIVSVIQTTNSKNTKVYWFETNSNNLVKIEDIYYDEATKVRKERTTKFFNYHRLSNGILVPEYAIYKSAVIEARINYLDFSFEPF